MCSCPDNLNFKNIENYRKKNVGFAQFPSFSVTSNKRIYDVYRDGWKHYQIAHKGFIAWKEVTRPRSEEKL